MLCSSELVIVRERKCTIQNSYFQTSFGVGVVSPCIFNLETSNWCVSHFFFRPGSFENEGSCLLIVWIVVVSLLWIVVVFSLFTRILFSFVRQI